MNATEASLWLDSILFIATQRMKKECGAAQLPSAEEDMYLPSLHQKFRNLQQFRQLRSQPK